MNEFAWVVMWVCMRCLTWYSTANLRSMVISFWQCGFWILLGFCWCWFWVWGLQNQWKVFVIIGRFGGFRVRVRIMDWWPAHWHVCFLFLLVYYTSFDSCFLQNPNLKSSFSPNALDLLWNIPRLRRVWNIFLLWSSLGLGPFSSNSESDFIIHDLFLERKIYRWLIP